MNNNFWNLEKKYLSNIALLDKDKNYTFEECFMDYSEVINSLTSNTQNKELAFLFCSNNYKTLIYYLSCLNSGIAVLLLDAKLNEEMSSLLIEKYNPKFIFSGEDRIFNSFKKIEINRDFNFFFATGGKDYVIHSDLAVLLSTSGTTGSPKLVKLSYKNIQSNAQSISEYLNIQQDDRSITSLPVSYSFGLSIINSYLLSGASLFLSNENIVLRNFWEGFTQFGCTSFSGVPYSYLLLRKIGFEKLNLPDLRTMTQAGGRLSNDLIEYYHHLSLKKNFNFYVMYGQTEATARISYVPPKLLGSKIGSIGKSIPGGRIDVIDEDGNMKAPYSEGELIYSGNNVMMGYAECSADLSKDDEVNGILKTGDLGYVDADGFFFITGRIKRFIKIAGLRVNLDEVEKMIEIHFNIFNACVGEDDNLKILLQANPSACLNIYRTVVEYYKIPKSSVTIKAQDKLPVSSSGKKDYAEIKKCFPGEEIRVNDSPNQKI